MPNKRVIDLSHHNIVPTNMLATAEAGVWGVIHKATEGGTYRDDKVGARFYLAKEAGLLWGLYHFLRPANVASIDKQVENFLSCWNEHGDENTLLVLDWEKSQSDSRAPNVDEAIDWLNKVEEKSGRRPVIYSGNVLKEAVGNQRHPTLNGDFYKLWLAQYSTAPKLPAGWSSYWLWQWTDAGSVPGVNPPTDLNDYQAGKGQLEAEWLGQEEEPNPEPEPGEKPLVKVYTDKPDGADLNVYVNDNLVYSSRS